MRLSIFLILLFCTTQSIFSQDKLFLENGTTRSGIIVSNAKDFIYFKSSDTSAIEKLDKSNIILIEDYKGTRYIIGKKRTNNSFQKLDTSHIERHLNYFGIQPLSIFVGRFSFAYERLSKDGRFGLSVPIILSFDPVGKFYNDTLFGSNYERTTGVGFVSGIDLNYYLGKKANAPFYIGPHLRYGVDKFLGATYYSLQTQVGWKFGKPNSKSVQHISFGFGFMRIVEVVGSQNVNSKQSYMWGNLTYRMSFSW